MKVWQLWIRYGIVVLMDKNTIKIIKSMHLLKGATSGSDIQETVSEWAREVLKKIWHQTVFNFNLSLYIHWWIKLHVTVKARPVTTSDQETDEDLVHEFDTPVMTSHERLTIGNIGYAVTVKSTYKKLIGTMDICSL